MKTNILILFLFILTKSFAQNVNVDYYPIKVGSEWKYKAPGKDWEEKFIVSAFENTYEAFLIKQIIKLGSIRPITNEELLEKRNGKVLQLGTRGGMFNTEWKLSSAIILESDLKIGQSWKNKKDEGELEEYKVIGFSDVVVTAGEFKNVLVLQKTVSGNSSKSKKKEILMETKLYYAPNVGLIKTEVLNRDKNIFSIFTELVDYKL